MKVSMEGLRSGADKVFAPVQSLSGVFIDTAEKMADLQIQSGKAYAQIAFGQWKKVPEIHNIEQAGDFVWGQLEPISEVNKQLLHDWKAAVSLNTEFTDGIKSAFVTKEPEPAAKPKPRSTPRKAKSGSAPATVASAKTAAPRATHKKPEVKDSDK